MDKKIKIIIIEDHSLTRIGLKTAFEESSNIEVIGEAEYGENGVTLALELEPDLVVMDLGLPNMNGIDATLAIKSQKSHIKVLILTSHDSNKQVIGALGAGADGYCLKDITPKRLISVIEGIVEGGMWLDPGIAKTVLCKLIKENDTDNNKPINTVSPLTDREVEVLQLLADGLGTIEMAQELNLSQHTVKAHIGNVLQKLSVDDRTQAVVRAMREGWVR